jgi:hypothetical protein
MNSRFLFYEGDYLAGFGVSAKLRFLEDGSAVDQYLETPATRRNHFELRLRKTLSNFCRQTGGTGLVVSNDAVFDADRHGGLVGY